MPMNFHDTPMGRTFFMKSIPSLIEAVNRLAEATEKSNALAERKAESKPAPTEDELGYYMICDYDNIPRYAKNMSEVEAELKKYDEKGESRENILIFPASAGFNILKEQ